MTLKVGLTGGIGSGKSIVSRIFNMLGIPVYNADESAKRLMQTDPYLIQSIKELFGEEAYLEGKLQRSYISKIVFENPDKLSALNAVVHPATIADAEKWFQNQETTYAIKEAALIFESDAHKQLDFIIGVFAPLELRISRTMQRDHATRDSVLKRIENQLNADVYRDKCQFTIDNDEQQLIIPQILIIHQKLIQSI
ncbi:MAG: dephospho-CoA kinase [Chitinophagaceae bacterium]